MAGWIKLWRKLIENGHLKMPGMAFKLWIYCLLEAGPYPDPKRDLTVGELWLSYKQIQENLGEGNKKISMSTISGALTYLEDNGYLTLQREKFKGIKAKVVNWGEYQSLVYKDTDLPTTREVAVAESPTTLTGVDDYSRRSQPTTSSVAITAAKPSKDKPFSSSKNYLENDLKNNNLVVSVTEDFEKEFGRSLSPIEMNQLANWQQTYSEELIKEALVRAALQDKRTIAYVGGILKNWTRAGKTTAAEVRQEQTKSSPKGGKRNVKVKPGYHPTEVDWANEPDTL